MLVGGKMEELLPKLIEWFSAFGLKLIGALATLIFGRFIVKAIRKFLIKLLEKKDVDPAIVSFTISITYTALWIFVILAALAQLGVETTSFMAVIGAAGLAIGLALQGSLSNFAAGVLIIILRPFKVDDYVEAAGISGMIKSINIFTTELTSFDNKKYIVPNSKIMDGTITNYTANKLRRVDLKFGIGYKDDFKKAKKIMNEIADEHELILNDQPSIIRLGELGDSSVNMTMKVWVKTKDYWNVYFDLHEQVKEKFDKAGISIPFPQMDVHMIKK